MKYLLFIFLFLVSCNAPQLKPDAAPAPADPLIKQARLEFSGCGYDSIVGTLACSPDQSVKVLTEFPGRVLMSSSGAGCELNQQIQAQYPYTEITRPKSPSGISCAVIVFYLPSYPNAASPVAVESLFGEVVFLPDDSFKYLGNLAISAFDSVHLTLSKIVRGAFVSRQLPKPVVFQGSAINFQPNTQGTDLILIKAWDAKGVVHRYCYTANYYSPSAQNLTYAISDVGLGWKRVTFPEAVSVFTFNGKTYFDTTFEFNPQFTKGLLRAYTAQGRTLILSLENL